MPALNQILAIDKAIRERVTAILSALHHATQKPALMNGFEKVYHPAEEGGEELQAEQQKVQFLAADVLQQLADAMSGLLDINASKDWTNKVAAADVIVEGKVLLPMVPVTHLLFLEKQLVHIHTFVSKIEQLDPAVDWIPDPLTGLWKSAPIVSHRTKKVTEVIVKYQATPEHPAQTDLVQIDKPAGTWTMVKKSGAISPTVKKAILARLDKLSAGVKFAREQANAVPVDEHWVGKPLFDYLFAR